MGKYWTLAEITEKIERDTDIEAEDFIQPDELVGLINEAIDEAETHIHTLGLEDDYFLTYVDYDITVGQELLDLPDDIYAHKIRGLMYSDQDLIYPIRRFRGQKPFEMIANAQHFSNSGDYHRYQLVNDGTDGNATPAPKALIVPAFRKTQTNLVRLWYIRNAKELVNDTDICDIPEFVSFVIKKVKFMIWDKEGHPNKQSAKGEYEQERERMISTLSTMVPDTDSEIPPDLRFYNETS